MALDVLVGVLADKVQCDGLVLGPMATLGDAALDMSDKEHDFDVTLHTIEETSKKGAWM